MVVTWPKLEKQTYSHLDSNTLNETFITFSKWMIKCPPLLIDTKSMLQY